MFGLIGSIIIGCLAGFIAGKIMRGGGFGFWMNLLLGIVGGVVGGWTFLGWNHWLFRNSCSGCRVITLDCITV